MGEAFNPSADYGNPYVGDCRRAASIVVHHAKATSTGVNAVLRETIERDRVTPLILALIDVYRPSCRSCTPTSGYERSAKSCSTSPPAK